MKILFQARPDYYTNPAGDTVQMVSTGNELKKLGIEIALSTDPNANLAPFDLIHIFNLTRIKESYLFFANAQKQKKKIVVSPIYWNPQVFLRKNSNPNALAVWRHLQPMRSRVIQECDLLLPNSIKEMESLKQEFPRTAPCMVVPNGFPDSFIASQPDPSLIRDQYPDLPDDFILCVARISPRKNQEWLAKACHELGLSLVLAGPVNDKTYYEQLMTYPEVRYLGTLRGQMLTSAYAAARAHALPSWFETPGLSSLEAGACGTVVISTDQGSPSEYFLDMALYVNPADPSSLPRALQLSSTASPLPLMHHVRDNYPWSKIAQKTLAAYEQLL